MKPINTDYDQLLVVGSRQETVQKDSDEFATAFAKELEKAQQSGNKVKGYAYVDKYGYSHVVASLKTALRFAKPNTEIYGYNGEYFGGYAINPTGGRMAVPLANAVPYGNEGKHIKNDSSENNSIANNSRENRMLTKEEFIRMFPQYLTGVIAYAPTSKYSRLSLEREQLKWADMKKAY